MPKTEPSEPSDRDLYAAFAGDATVDVGSRHLLAAVLERTVGLGLEAVEFGRFELGRRLGAGGMGVVYEAHDPVLGRKVALKVLRRSAGDQLGVALQEAQLMAGVVHANIVYVHEVGIDEGRAWIVMELVEGTTLRRWQRESRAQWRQLVDVYVRAGRGLAAAHERGLVHGDFKPDNVLVGDGDVPRVVKVTDFGLARGGHGEGTLGGTPEYMAPEQYLLGVRDHRSEQFSFCVALFEVLTGVHPYSRWSPEELAFTVGSDDSDRGGPTVRQRYCRELLRNMAQRDLRWPRRPLRIPRRLRRALERGLAIDPEARFDSMTELLAAIDLEQARRTRSRWLLGTAAGVAVGVGATWLGIESQRAEECRGAEERFATVWNDDVRVDLERTRPEAAGELGLALDRYGRGWAETHHRACERTAGQGEWARWRPVRECLDQRLAAVRAVVEELDELERPLSAVGELALRSPATCELDTAEVSAPLPGTEGELARIHAGLAAAFADEVAQRHDRGLARMEEIVAAARELGYEPLLAESYLQRGRLRIQQAFYAGAGASGRGLPGLDDLEHAELVAERASARSVYADAWIFRRKAVAVAGAPEQPGDEDEWVDLGLDDLPDQHAEWLEQRGLRAYNRGLLDPESKDGRHALARASEWYEQALRLREAIGDGIGRAKLLENMGNALVQQGEPAQALERYGAAVEFWRGRGGGEGYLPYLYASQINAMVAMLITESIDPAEVDRLIAQALEDLAGDPRGRLAVSLPAIMASWGRPSAWRHASWAMEALDQDVGADRLHEVQLRIFALGALLRGPSVREHSTDLERWSKALEELLRGGSEPSFATLTPDIKTMAWSYLGKAHLLRGSLSQARVLLQRAHDEAPAGLDALEGAHLELDLAEVLAGLGEAEAAEARERAQRWIDGLARDAGEDEPPIPELRERLARQGVEP